MSIPEPVPDAAEQGWRRLSRRMLLIHPVQELLRAWPLLIGLFFAGSGGGHGSWWSVVGTAVVVGAGLSRWFTTTYRIGPDQVQVRKGLLRRRVLSVPSDRVRTVDVTANVLHRVFGLARVEVGTGRSDRKREGLRLDALGAAEAARLRDELLHRRAPARNVAPARETTVAAVRPEWVRYGPFTLTGLVTVGVVAGFWWRIASETGVDPRRSGPLRGVSHQFGHASLALETIEAVVALAVLVVVASTVAYVVAFLNFRLTRNDAGTLHVARGLFTTRKTTIEERRLRGVELSEPLLLRMVRGARCIAVTTGLRVGRGAERGGSLLLPPAPRSEAVRVAASVLGSPEPVSVPLVPHGTGALRRRFGRSVAACGSIIVVLLGFWRLGWVSPWAWFASLALLPAGALLAFDRYRVLGHAVTGGFLVARSGSLVRRRTMLSCDGIIGWNLRRSFFQRRAGLVSLTATTAAGRQRVLIQDLPEASVLHVAEKALPGLLAPFIADRPVPRELHRSV